MLTHPKEFERDRRIAQKPCLILACLWEELYVLAAQLKCTGIIRDICAGRMQLSLGSVVIRNYS